MARTSLVGEVYDLCVELWGPLKRGKFQKHVFEKLLNKLVEYAEATKDEEKIDRRVADGLFSCYLAFQGYWYYSEKAHPDYEEVRNSEREINKVTTRILGSNMN
jgi:hypothetical protein